MSHLDRRCGPSTVTRGHIGGERQESRDHMRVEQLRVVQLQSTHSESMCEQPLLLSAPRDKIHWTLTCNVELPPAGPRTAGQNRQQLDGHL